jgi:hypothetical protein
MEKKEDHGSKIQKSEAKKLSREYLHSISRIGDRLKMLRRDLTNMREEVHRDLEDMEEDVQMLSDAFDSLFNDLLTRIHNTDHKYEVEEI